jgi:hypothetical protein
MHRWRDRRRAGLAAAMLALAAAIAGAVTAADSGDPQLLVIRDASGNELARAALPSTESFALRYRNSVYHSNAEEHFVVDDDRLRLVELRAEELAVLEEYYSTTGAVRASGDSTLGWRVAVGRPPIELPLRVRATELGRRTLVVGDQVIALWALVAGRDDSLVVLSVEEAR